MKNNFIAKFLLAYSLIFTSFIYYTSVPTYSQPVNASILPLAKTQFLDSSGKPLAAGKVFFYIPNTTTPKTTWQDADGNVANTNPVILDGAGRALIYGEGEYRQIVRDRNNNLIWDQITASPGSGGGGGTLIGDGNLVGTILPWSGLIAPNQYVFAYGQEISRVTYPAYFTAITYTQTANCTLASPTITGFADTSQIPVGAPVETVCVAPGSTVISKTVSSITVSSNAVVSTSATITVFPWGNGDGLTTYNVPDLRGRTIPGRDNMGGTAANRLTAPFYGETAAALGANGGLESRTLVTANLPPYTPAGILTMDPHFHYVFNTGSGAGSLTSTTYANRELPAGAGDIAYQINGSAPAATLGKTSDTTSTGSFTGTPQGGTSTAIPTIQPSITVNYIVKITPDVSASSATGVASLGGMTGVIACGTGIICSSNNVSVDSSTLTFSQNLTNSVPYLLQNKVRQVVSVKDFGALGDGNGLTGIGNDDTVFIQNAFNAVASTGTQLYFPCGVYRITSTITGNIYPSIYDIDGAGYCAKIYLDTLSNTVAFSFNPPTDCPVALIPCVKINGINFITPTTSGTSSNGAVYANKSQGFTFTKNYIDGYYLGLTIEASFGAKVNSNTISSTKSSAIFSTDASFNSGSISGNYLYLNGITTSDAAVNIQAPNGALIIHNNNVESNYAGFIFNGASLGSSFTSNYLENNTLFDVNWNAASNGWIVSNNRIGSGLTTSWDNLVNSTVTGNICGGGGGTISYGVTSFGNVTYNNISDPGGLATCNFIDNATNLSTFTYGGLLQSKNTSDTTAINTGAVQTLGGLYVAKQSFLGGNILIPGSSSGTIRLAAQAVASTPTLTWPTGTGTFAVTASAPIVLSATTGNLTCPTCGVTGSPLSQFAATTSAQLLGVISDETGSGSLVFATSPTFVTPVLGVAAATSVAATSFLQSGVVAVASLPTCNAGLAGGRMVVNNANATTFLSIVAGGGANIVPVTCNGTNWVIG